MNPDNTTSTYPSPANLSDPSAPPVDPTVNATSLVSAYATTNTDTSRFDLLVKQNELNPIVAEQLRDVLSSCEIVLLCDDSDSMSLPIAEEGTDPFAPKRSTRWLELKKLASVIIQFVTAINANGLDIYFLNRPKVCYVNSPAGLQSIFNIPPHGTTNLTEALLQIYQEKKKVAKTKKLLIVVITDGEPVDETDMARQNLFNAINQIVENGNNNIHVSFAECTDNAEDMEYLDQWDGLIKNFDNSDDFREELQRVRNIQGPQFKFNFVDYTIKILLATFVRWYFNLDQVKVTTSQQLAYQPSQNPQYSVAMQQQYSAQQWTPSLPQAQTQPQMQSQIAYPILVANQQQYPIMSSAIPQLPTYQVQYAAPNTSASSPTIRTKKKCCLLL